jgi:6-pyruvoyltetrahydropterin/6-carboxytetrahydropterin synthase
MSTPVVFLTRRATFSAAHRLYDPKLDDKENAVLFGKCTNPHYHGHNYVLEVTLRGPINQSGILLNLVDVKRKIEECVLEYVDHKNLNEEVPFLVGVNPTVENLVVAFWTCLSRAFSPGQLYEVRLMETENNWAFYRGESEEG